jgi:alkylated DNA repair protein alkB family protein 1
VPDAALVNYYHSGDTLNGHKDDVEKDLDQPIVTVSLGCDAVFLLGGTTR